MIPILLATRGGFVGPLTHAVSHKRDIYVTERTSVCMLYNFHLHLLGLTCWSSSINLPRKENNCHFAFENVLQSCPDV